MENRESYPILLWEKSHRVYAVQNMLRYLGFDQGRDGTYGPITQGNVKKFQRMAGIEEDGIVGFDTMEALARECIYKKP